MAQDGAGLEDRPRHMGVSDWAGLKYRPSLKRPAKVNTKTTTPALFIVAWLLVAPPAVHASAVYPQATIIYTVRAGDTLSAIGARYGVTYQAIMRANNLTDTLIVPGQRLAIPTGSQGVSASAAPARAPSTGDRYIVRPGDSLWAIASRYNIPVDALKQANGLVSTVIVAGQTLRIPPPGLFPPQTPSAPVANRPAACPANYTVRRGDTLSAIAATCQTTVVALKFANGLAGDSIWVGQVLLIPGGGSPAPTATPSPTPVHSTWLPSVHADRPQGDR